MPEFLLKKNLDLKVPAPPVGILPNILDEHGSLLKQLK
jgi:hypothetical protein